MAPFMGCDGVYDGGGVTSDDGRDLGVAVAASGVVTDQPPELLAGGDHGPRAAAAEQLLAGDTAARGDIVDDVEQCSGSQGMEGGLDVAHDGPLGERFRFRFRFPLPL